MTEQEMLNTVETTVTAQINQQTLIPENELLVYPVGEYSFDRADDLAFMPEDYCVDGIAALCCVKIWYTKRDEKALFTNDIHKVRLLSILGIEADVKLAHWIYELVGNTISNSFTAFANTLIYKRNPTPLDAATSFKIGMATRINLRLRELAAPGTELAGIKRQKLREALEARNYTFNAVAAKETTADATLSAKRPRVRLNG